jgi:hypothetical protein
VLANATSPFDWRTKPYTVLKPRPVPRPSSLVVKNGSNARARTSSLMPAPVSAMAIVMKSCGCTEWCCGPPGMRGNPVQGATRNDSKPP